jgi:hypothetical protein
MPPIGFEPTITAGHVSSITCSYSGGTTQTALGIQRAYNESYIIRTQYTKSRCVTPPEDEQVMLETCRGTEFLINWIKSASHWFNYTDALWCTVNKTLSSQNLKFYSENPVIVVRSRSALHLGKNAPYPWTERLVICKSGSKPEFLGTVASKRAPVPSAQKQLGA